MTPRRAVYHKRVDDLLYQVNAGDDHATFEVVALRNGFPVARASFWAAYESWQEGIAQLARYIDELADKRAVLAELDKGEAK